MVGAGREAEEIAGDCIVGVDWTWVGLEVGTAGSRTEDLAAADVTMSFVEVAVMHMEDWAWQASWADKEVERFAVVSENSSLAVDKEDKCRQAAKRPFVGPVAAARDRQGWLGHGLWGDESCNSLLLPCC